MNTGNYNRIKKSYDAVVVGAGISGVVFLKYARDKNLRCLALEKQEDIGGLWKNLPAWQDIQNKKKDFTINNVPLKGVNQPDIHRFIHAWVDKYELDPFIRLNCGVTSVERDNNSWEIYTNQGIFKSDYLIVATGIHNTPWIPELERIDPSLEEIHSSELVSPDVLENKRVTVVGGGTSSWDLLEQALKNNADEIHWTHRKIKWFLPTNGRKHSAWPNIRELALVQSVLRSIDGQNKFLRYLLRIKYRLLKLTHLMPDETFDFRKHQLIPGRSLMCRNLDKIHRHQSEIKLIVGNKLILEDGNKIETDVLLWATGYRMDLSFLGLPEYKEIKKLDDLYPRLGSLTRSLDYPNLFFMSMTILGSTSATPLFSAIEARSIVSYILGKCEIPKKNIPHLVNHWDLFGLHADFDRYNYSSYWWKIKYFLLALLNVILPWRTVKI